MYQYWHKGERVGENHTDFQLIIQIPDMLIALYRLPKTTQDTHGTSTVTKHNKTLSRLGYLLSLQPRSTVKINWTLICLQQEEQEETRRNKRKNKKKQSRIKKKQNKSNKNIHVPKMPYNTTKIF